MELLQLLYSIAKLRLNNIIRMQELLHKYNQDAAFAQLINQGMAWVQTRNE